MPLTLVVGRGSADLSVADAADALRDYSAATGARLTDTALALVRRTLTPAAVLASAPLH